MPLRSFFIKFHESAPIFIFLIIIHISTLLLPYNVCKRGANKASSPDLK